MRKIIVTACASISGIAFGIATSSTAIGIGVTYAIFAIVIGLKYED